MSNQQQRPNNQQGDLTTVVNISNHTLSTDEKQLLSKGLNFAPTPRNIPTETYINKLEPIIQGLREDNRADARLQITNALR